MTCKPDSPEKKTEKKQKEEIQKKSGTNAKTNNRSHTVTYRRQSKETDGVGKGKNKFTIYSICT